MNREAFDIIRAAVRDLDYPTTGEVAELIWRALSGPGGDKVNCGRLYRQLGYEPFTGYPLTRLARPPQPQVKA